MRKIKLFMMTLLLAAGSVCGYAVTIGDINYSLSGNTATVTGLANSAVTELVIPAEVEYDGTNYSVTGIGGEAFKNCTGLTSATIPESVTIIGWGAFLGCTGLTSVTIPNSVKYIGQCAFDNCTGLTSIKIPNSVTAIGEPAFAGCTGLTSIIVAEGNPTYDSRNNCNCIIETSSNTLIEGCKNSVIPNSVTSIGRAAFESCKGLTSVTIPNSVTTIDYDAFRNCTGLTSVTIPNSVTSIGSSAFAYCTGLTSVTIPNSVTSIGHSAFSECSNLASIEIPNSVTSIEGCVFEDCTALTSVTIPNSVTTIEWGAFLGCSGLTSIEIPNSVTTIEECAFYGCTGLTSITIPNSVTRIEGSAFQQCTGLTSVTIPNSVTRIEDSAFRQCTGLTSVTIPNSVTTIEWGAFLGCSGLTSIEIPNSVTSIGQYAFHDCTGLTSVKYLSQEPYGISDNCFSSYDATLYVLYGYEEKVKELAGWKNFKNIVELPEDYNEDDPYADKYIIYVTASQGGSVLLPDLTVSGKTDSLTVIADEITELTLSLEADNGYRLASLKVNGINVTADITDDTYTIKDVIKNTQIVATFEKIPVPSEFDINNDGGVNTADVVAVYTYIEKGTDSGFTKESADVNNDGNVNTADVVKIYDYIINGEGDDPTPGDVTTYTVNGVSFKMIPVEGGTFEMGKSADGNNWTPVHNVTLSSYSIGETEVTQALWTAVMGSNPSYFKGDNLPVEEVSWNDCQTFITKLNQLTGESFRLPTEAEWEFAAKGGTKSKGYTYSGSNTIDDVAWHTSNSSYKTHEVATKSPNELGIYDMSGNVWEWCQDWYGSYSSSAQTDPTGPASGSDRVRRGGGWRNNAASCRTANRGSGTPTIASDNLGLRLAL